MATNSGNHYKFIYESSIFSQKTYLYSLDKKKRKKYKIFYQKQLFIELTKTTSKKSMTQQALTKYYSAPGVPLFLLSRTKIVHKNKDKLSPHSETGKYDLVQFIFFAGGGEEAIECPRQGSQP